LADFRLLNLLGYGGMGAVFLAEDIKLQLSQYIQEPIVSVIVNKFSGTYSQQVRVVGATAKPTVRSSDAISGALNIPLTLSAGAPGSLLHPPCAGPITPSTHDAAAPGGLRWAALPNKIGPTKQGSRMQGLFLDATAELAGVFEAVVRPDDPPVRVNRQADVAADALAGLLAGYDFVLDDHTALPTATVRRCPGLRHVIFLGTGARSYMSPEELAGLGITVHTIKGYGDTAVAEHTIALMWAAARGVAGMDRARVCEEVELVLRALNDARALTADLYAASMAALPSDLADALVSAGTSTAMELDINPEWVQLAVAPVPGGTLATGVPGQNRPADQYVVGWTRDFVTVLAAG